MGFKYKSRKTKEKISEFDNLDRSISTDSSVNKELVKKIILELLKTDEEFRYAVAGYIGYETVMNELKALRIDLNKLYEKSIEYSKRLEAIENILIDHTKRLETIENTLINHSKRLETTEKILTEHSKRLEIIENTLIDHTKQLEIHTKQLEIISNTLVDHAKRLETIEKTLIEHTKTLVDHTNILIDHTKRLETIENTLINYAKILEKHSRVIEEHTVVLKDLKTKVDKIDLELGAMRETLFCDLIMRDLEIEIKNSGDKILSYERNATINNVEIDLLVITEKRIYVVEVKTKPRVEDVYELVRKVDVVRDKHRDKEVLGVLAGTWIGDDVIETALSRNIRIIKK